MNGGIEVRPWTGETAGQREEVVRCGRGTWPRRATAGVGEWSCEGSSWRCAVVSETSFASRSAVEGSCWAQNGE